MILPAPTHGSTSSSSGTTVVLPAPGGATSTAEFPADNAAFSAGSASWIGSMTRSTAWLLSALALRRFVQSVRQLARLALGSRDDDATTQL